SRMVVGWSQKRAEGIPMRNRIALGFALLIAVASPAFAKGGGHSSGHSTHATRVTTPRTSSAGVHTVRSYTKRDGTHVESYHATNPNSTKNDNFSTRGNVNPYTGKAGTKARDGE